MLSKTIIRSLPHRRAWLKFSHALMIPLLVWFIFVTPDDVLPFGPAAFQAHSLLALVFVTISLIWYGDYLRRGLAGRPGPKLGPKARQFHRILHIVMIWGLFGVAVTGFLIGLTASRLLKAGGILPIAPPLGLPQAHEIIGKIHIYEFYLLGVIVIVHAGFHIWRHVRLRDNALRIMAPRILHKIL